LRGIHLIDFKVRILDASANTDAVTRVLIDSTDGDDTWTTIGVSANLIEASWMALSTRWCSACCAAPQAG
jgi:2-isopropylmalate synthase